MRLYDPEEGQILLDGHDIRTLKLFDLSTMGYVETLFGHQAPVLAVDALGAAMIKHGEEFGEDSAYGQSLVSFGRAHCNVASLQESYALTLEETYLTAVRQSEDEIKEYQAQRKKLESRRCVLRNSCLAGADDVQAELRCGGGEAR